MSQVSFGDDVRAAFGVIESILNSSEDRGGVETLTHVSELRRIAAENDLSFVPSGSNAEQRAMLRLRGRLEDAAQAPGIDERISIINSLLVAAGSIPQINRHPGNELPHLHWTMDDASFESKVTALVAMGLSRLVILDAFDRLRVCDGPDCNRVFIDVSKNGLRRFHDTATCGNRHHAASYRARKEGREQALQSTSSDIKP